MHHSTIGNELNELLNELEKIRVNDFKKALELSGKTYLECEKQDYPIGMCYSLFVKGSCLSFLGKYTDAISFLFRAINLATVNNICDLQILINISLGNIFLDMSNYEESFSFYNSAAKLCLKLNNSVNYYSDSDYNIYYCKICNNIAEIYRILGDYDSASNLYTQAVELDRKTNFKGTSGISLSNLGSISLLRGHLAEAKKQTLDSLKILYTNNYYITITECYTNLAVIYEKEGSEDKAKAYYQKAINSSKNNTAAFYLLDSIIYYSMFLRKHGDISAAIENLNNALSIAEDNKLLKKCVNVCKELAICYGCVDDMENSNKYFNLYFKFNDEFTALSNDQILTSIKIKLKLDALEDEKLNLMKKNYDYRKHSEMLLHNLQKMKILSELGQKLTSAQTVNDIVQILSTNINKFIDAHNFSLALYDNDMDRIVFKCSSINGKHSKLPQLSLRNGKSLSDYCVRQKKLLVINDFKKHSIKQLELTNHEKSDISTVFKSVIYCPLLINDTALGVMSVHSYVPNHFTALDVETMKALASYAAISINNSLKSSYLKVEIANKEKVKEDLVKVNGELKYLSENDFLTKLANRRKFNSTMLYEWKKCLDEKQPLSIIIFDVDYFKEFNDNYGHLMGDECLSKIAAAFMNCIDENFTAARFGGDEFIAVLPGVHESMAEEIGKKITASIKELKIEHKFSKTASIVTISLGTASIVPDAENSIDQLLKMADEAMYKIKIGRTIKFK